MSAMSKPITAVRRNGICQETDSGTSPAARMIKKSREKTNRIGCGDYSIVDLGRCREGRAFFERGFSGSGGCGWIRKVSVFSCELVVPVFPRSPETTNSHETTRKENPNHESHEAHEKSHRDFRSAGIRLIRQIRFQKKHTSAPP